MCLYHLDECVTQVEFCVYSRNFDYAVLVLVFITFYIAQLTLAILQIINHRSRRLQEKREADLRKKVEKEIFEQATTERLEKELKQRIKEKILKEKTGKEE